MYMNRKFLIIIVIAAMFAAKATEAFSQVKGKVRGGFEIGLTGSTEGQLGFGYIGMILGGNIQDNMNVGIKFGYGSIHSYEINANWVSESSKSFMKFAGFYNYYFISRSNFFMPFVGGGFGLYGMQYRVVSREEGDKFGGFLTAGFELWKFRLAAEYNLIPASKFTRAITVYNPQLMTTRISHREVKISNSHFTITAGFYFGGGNRKKEAATNLQH